MKPSLILIFLISLSAHAQLVRLEGKIPTQALNDGIGQIMIFSKADSSLVKGSYLDSSYFSVLFEPNGEDDFYSKIKVMGYSDTIVSFTVNDSIVNLGLVVLVADKELSEVEVVYKEPMYERSMDGIKVNVEGTNLQTLTNLFEVLKASPRLSSPDDEGIEIIGKGAPLILIDRQAVISNDELKAVPANMIDRIEIITNPSAKYRAQGRGSGVIEVYTKDFHLQGYNMTISAAGGMNTQLRPAGRLSLGLSMKKKKFSLSAYASGNYNQQLQFGSREGVAEDGSDRSYNSSYEDEGWRTWQHLNIKSAYRINDKHKISGGVRGGGSLNKAESNSSSSYFQEGTLTTDQNQEENRSNTWLNNSAFLNYQWETDTNKSVFEINLNYVLKIWDANSTFTSDFEDLSSNVFNQFNRQNISKNRPNIGEIRANYEHVFDTSGWKLSGGFAYNLLVNEKRFDQYNLQNGDWVIDPLYSNSYDYTENIGTVYLEGTKDWDKVSIRAGLSGEYTDLYGYSNSLDQKFMDSVYFLPFPSASIMYKPVKKWAFSLNYSSGIRRPQFSNYDPFVRIEDSLSIQYGNPYLQPSIVHSTGIDIDFNYSYSLGISYTFKEDPVSSLSFVDDSTFLINTTPWNADKTQSLNVHLSLPIRLDWLSGWNSLWFNYNRHDFTDEFNRQPFFNITYGMWSSLTFSLPKNFAIISRLFIHKWGSDSFTGNTQVRWGLKLRKRMFNNKFQIYLDASNITAPVARNEYFNGNYRVSSESFYQFTTFKLGIFIKFGRLKQAANIKESKSGQSGRI